MGKGLLLLLSLRRGRYKRLRFGLKQSRTARVANGPILASLRSAYGWHSPGRVGTLTVPVVKNSTRNQRKAGLRSALSQSAILAWIAEHLISYSPCIYEA